MGWLGWTWCNGDDAMTIINTSDAKQYRVNGTVSIDASFKRDGESTEVKTVTLRVNLDNVSLADIIADALKPKRITWQNNVARKHFDSIDNRSTVDINYSTPGKRELSTNELVAKLATKTSDIDGLIAQLEAYKLAQQNVNDDKNDNNE
jgi:hypothetical protein